MGKPDINLHSFNGPDWNDQTVDWAGWKIIPGPEIADTIKCSTGLKDCRLMFGTVYNGYEDALDVNNRCRDLDISARLWIFDQPCRTGFTIKGGSQNIRVSGLVRGDPLIDIGNASDQSHEWTGGIRLGLRSESGKPLRVRVLAGNFPVEEPGSGPFRYIFPSNFRWSPLRRLVVKIQLELRRHGIG